MRARAARVGTSHKVCDRFDPGPHRNTSCRTIAAALAMPSRLNYCAPVGHDSDEKAAERVQQAVLADIARAKQNAERVIQTGRAWTEAGQQMLDLANAVEKVVIYPVPEMIGDAIFFKHTIGGLREFNILAEGTRFKNATELGHRLSTLSSTSVTSAAVSSSLFAWEVPDKYPQVRPLVALQRRSADSSVTKQLLQEFGLDTNAGQDRSAHGLLVSAEDALKAPSSADGYEASVLIPLRESINRAVDELLKRRKSQREIKGGLKGKITELAEQCGRDGSSPEDVARVADTTHLLNDRLSGAKKRTMTREEIGDLFAQGVGVLKDILTLVDRAKLRA
jgi:hypothetical protein